MKSILSAAVVMSAIGFAASPAVHADVVVKTPSVGVESPYWRGHDDWRARRSSVNIVPGREVASWPLRAGLEWRGILPALVRAVVDPGEMLAGGIRLIQQERCNALYTTWSYGLPRGLHRDTDQPAPRPVAATYVAPAPTTTYVTAAPSYAPSTTTVIRSP